MSDMTPAEAAALVEADKQRRVKLAAEAVQAALAAHNCDLVAMPTITPQGTLAAVVQLIAK
jgi:uncharacterized protein YabE (DUF348 family)